MCTLAYHLLHVYFFELAHGGVWDLIIAGHLTGQGVANLPGTYFRCY